MPCHGQAVLPCHTRWLNGVESRGSHHYVMGGGRSLPLRHAACTANTVPLSGCPMDHTGAACGWSGQRVSSYGAWLDRHSCCTGRQSWSARPGSLGTALTRGVLGREPSMCPRRAGLWSCWVLRNGGCPYRFMGCAEMSPTGCWAVTI